MLESFQSNRLSDRMHAAFQIVLVFLILGAINFIGMRSFQRFDLTANSQYSLSPETLAYLKQLDRPVQAIVTITDTNTSDEAGWADVLKDVRQMLREYEYATRDQGANRVTVDYLNIYSQTSRARELGIDRPNAIIFKSGERQRLVTVNELYNLQDEEVREFLGENAFTRSILEVVESAEPVIYFTTGHGELNANDVDANTGASVLFNELKVRNFNARPLDLSAATEVPKDAAAVVVAAPRARFLPQEQLLLQTYLDRRAGRLLVLLEPGKEHGLEDLFYSWGILAEDVLVAERDPSFVISGGDLMIKRFAEHPITDSLLQLKIPLVTDRAMSVRADPGRPMDDSMELTELLASSDKSWGERRYREPPPYRYDPSTDLAPPVKMAAVAERKVDSSLGISLPGGKLIVVGTANFATNKRIQASGNLNFLLNAINFSIDRATRLNIPPRPIRKVKLDLSIEELHLARYLIWFGPPAVIGLLGLLVYLFRRN